MNHFPLLFIFIYPYFLIFSSFLQDKIIIILIKATYLSTLYIWHLPILIMFKFVYFEAFLYL